VKIIKFVLAVTLVSLLFSYTVQASDIAVTPPPGDPLRKEILDTIRQEVKEMHGLDVVFVVRHLKVKDGWAWVHVLPQSPDGKNKYEDISALLQLKWKVSEIPCRDGGDSECVEGYSYFKQLQKRYPGVPEEIFPDLNSNPE
jgi:hypothetical protein